MEKILHELPNAWEEEKWGQAISIGYYDVNKAANSPEEEFRDLLEFSRNKKERKKIKRMVSVFLNCNWDEYLYGNAYRDWEESLLPTPRGMSTHYLCQYGRRLYNYYINYPEEFKKGLHIVTGYDNIEELIMLVPKFCK